jgi:hypothetical protein
MMSSKFIRVGLVLVVIVSRDEIAKCMSCFYNCVDSSVQGHLNPRSSCLARTPIGITTLRVTMRASYASSGAEAAKCLVQM